MSDIKKINVESTTYTIAVDTDTTLAVSGKPADAKATGDRTGNLSNLITTDKSNLVAAINEAAASGGGLDLSDLTLTAVQSQTEGFSTLSMSDGTTTKTVDIPVATLSTSDVTLLTNIVDDYLDNLVNGDGVSY